MHRAQDVGVQREAVGALAKESDLVLEGQHQQLVEPEELAEAAVLGEKLERLAGGAVGAGAQLTQLVTLHLAKSQESEIKERLVSDDADVVRQASDLVEDLSPPSTLLFDELADEGRQQEAIRLHDAGDAIVGVDVGQ